jgi:hypothetical protein
MKSLADFLWTLVRWSLPLTVAGVVAAEFGPVLPWAGRACCGAA